MSSSTSRVGSFVPSQNYGRVSRYRSVSTHFNLVFDFRLEHSKLIKTSSKLYLEIHFQKKMGNKIVIFTGRLIFCSFF